ncbi:aspartate-semialdehyde dehydrogenase [Rickettsia japonica]|uniref:Aspartate-semialdehyde dehydrogenase n=2 Tax=Rickettsia japonica TaxID=35790 RepID=A0AAD1CAM0_RICJA|nr:aspartate-semialdehyde dehydrogenase [Rickettsia japonica]AXU06377.1 aspartate-semialdehyde dehydrogenase [Rickettsia japonica]QHE25050.1 aspartate-semialdehyde dehydrogenase [Rickettsia japonica]BAK96556.1 aspartate-semialdehyde dehydrogenase [Rickettsia japonica YH]BAW82634.1 aspartate-semialdehyde dehydrogenase [Rickettsia japonica]
MTKKYNIAVIGATGNVGRETLNILAERNFPINKVYAIASDNSLGREVSFGEKILQINSLKSLHFDDIDIAFFCAGSEVSKEFIPKATASNCVVIDKSSLFRVDNQVPLIVPEVNLSTLKKFNTKNIIANPNCIVIPLAVALKPLDNEIKIKRVVISTYQSVSGAGKAGMDELYDQTKSKYVFGENDPKKFPKQIAFNLFPHIGDLNKDGYTSEEAKIASELNKIIGNHFKASVTSVRVPVFIGHSISVNIEFKDKIDAKEVEEILQDADGIVTISNNNYLAYISPVEVVGEDAVYVSRIRNDVSRDNTINLWITCDNLRKGAALNSVQIAEELINNYL